MSARLASLVLLTALFVAAPFHAAFAQTAPSPFTAQNFAVLAGTTVTNTGPTVITGDLGVHPGSAVTGFPPGLVFGTIHAADAVALGAQSDLVDAYGDLDGQPCDQTFPGAADLVGLTLAPGVYCSASSLFLSGTLTLDAQFDPSAVWVFKTGSTLISASSSTVRIINEGQHCNVYWKVGSSATLGSGSTFIGNIIALTSIGLNSTAKVSGRVLARNGAVTLNNNTVAISACSDIVTPPGNSPALALSKTADRITYTAVDQTIVYTYILKNTGGTTLTGPFTVTDDKLGTFTCGSGDLAPGETVTCTRDYTIVAGDLGSESNPPYAITAKIKTGEWLQSANSTQATKITNASPGSGVANGTYRCWCIQDYVPLDLHDQMAKLYSTVGGGLPSDVANLAWKKVNYTLNHKIRGPYTGSGANLKFLKDVQTAIWVLLGETNPEWGVSATAQQMINAANANADFAPASGDVVAVLVYSDGIAAQRRSWEVQESICEMNSKLKSIVNKATGSGGGVLTVQVQVTVKQVR